MQDRELRIAILLPCYNEEAAIGQTVAGFRAALPGARTYVYDNNSTDRTREIAAEAGAIVRTERMQGKGHVVRRMFADIEADIYVMADGDATYDSVAAPALVRRLVDEHLDMVVGSRKSHAEEAYLLAAAAIVLAAPLAITYAETGLVPRFPTAILVTGMMVVAALSFMTGLILDTVVRGRREVRRLHYLALPAVGDDGGQAQIGGMSPSAES